MKPLRKHISFIVSLPLVLIVVIICNDVRAEFYPFPEYSCIQPNVSFWKKIYSEYSSEQGVIHDNRNLNIIYGIIELKNPDMPGNRKINRNRIKTAKRKYKQILAKLRRGETPSEPEEQYVADLFGPDAKSTDYQTAMRNIRCQVGQKDRFREGLIRSGAYLEEIKQIFREFGLPEDLAYLPHVESSFNPKAYSKFGAAGIWQFTRSTGRRYMTVGYTVDERRDPILSSRAAAKYLKDNYQKLLSWPMAITAYNHGTTGVLRAQRRKGGYEAIFKEYRSRIFKFASRNFYSEFLAAREIAKYYRQYFGDLTLDTPVNTTEVALNGYASLPEMARHLNLDVEVISELNPALRRPVIRGQKYVPKGYRLRLPADSGQDWKNMIAELSPKLFKNFQKHSRIYTVRRGDTAGKIAKMHGVKLRDLIVANNLDFRATIYVNQNLRIPLPDEKPVKLAKIENRKQNRKNAAKSQRSPAMEGQPLKTPTVDMLLAMNARSEARQTEEDTVGGSSIIEVDQKETELESAPVIASLKPDYFEEDKENELPQLQQEEEEVDEDIAPMPASVEADGIEETAATESASTQPTEDNAEPNLQPAIDVGKVQPAVLIPQGHPEIIQANLAFERIWNQNGNQVGTIRVEAEETLGHYAEWSAVTAWEIRRLNGFPYGSIIHLDQQIKIPLHRATKEEFEEKRFEYHKELTEDFFTSYRVEKVDVYYIKRGDNIWTLSREEFEVPLWLIRRYNTHLDFNALVPTQELLVPVVEKIA
jgi:membrane-bound lytic murein transglycosylase D